MEKSCPDRLRRGNCTIELLPFDLLDLVKHCLFVLGVEQMMGNLGEVLPVVPIADLILDLS